MHIFFAFNVLSCNNQLFSIFHFRFYMYNCKYNSLEFLTISDMKKNFRGAIKGHVVPFVLCFFCICNVELIFHGLHLSRDMRFPTMWRCDQQRLRLDCAYAQSDQSLCLSLKYHLTVKRQTEHHLEFLSLKGGFPGLSESTLVKMPNCWKSHVAAHSFLKLTTGYYGNI